MQGEWTVFVPLIGLSEEFLWCHPTRPGISVELGYAHNGRTNSVNEIVLVNNLFHPIFQKSEWTYKWTNKLLITFTIKNKLHGKISTDNLTLFVHYILSSIGYVPYDWKLSSNCIMRGSEIRLIHREQNLVNFEPTKFFWSSLLRKIVSIN